MGLKFHSYTYAKYGGEMLNQPGMFAWQVFDQKVTHLLPDEYRIPRITKEKPDTFEGLAERLEGVGPRRFLKAVRAFNAAPRPQVPFNPNIRDGLAIDKTNWAQRLDTPPYEAYAVTTGITFTFGGLKITNNAEVEDTQATRSTPPANSSAASSSTTTPAAPASCPAPSSAASPAETGGTGETVTIS